MVRRRVRSAAQGAAEGVSQEAAAAAANAAAAAAAAAVLGSPPGGLPHSSSRTQVRLMQQGYDPPYQAYSCPDAHPVTPRRWSSLKQRRSVFAMLRRRSGSRWTCCRPSCQRCKRCRLRRPSRACRCSFTGSPPALRPGNRPPAAPTLRAKGRRRQRPSLRLLQTPQARQVLQPQAQPPAGLPARRRRRWAAQKVLRSHRPKSR